MALHSGAEKETVMHLKLQSMIHAFQCFLWLQRHRLVMQCSQSC